MMNLRQALEEAVTLSERHKKPYFLVQEIEKEGNEDAYNVANGELIFPHVEKVLMRVDTHNGIHVSIAPWAKEKDRIEQWVREIVPKAQFGSIPYAS